MVSSLPTWALVIIGVYLLLGFLVVSSAIKKHGKAPRNFFGWLGWTIGMLFFTVFWMPTLIVINIFKAINKRRRITDVVLGVWHESKIVVYINGRYLSTVGILDGIERISLLALRQDVYPGLTVFIVPDYIENRYELLIELENAILKGAKSE